MIPENNHIRWAVSGFVTTLFLASSHVALGQTYDPRKVETARPLVEEAATLKDAGKFAEAVSKLEEAKRLVPNGIGVHLALGECYESMGRLGSACQQYTEAEQYARWGEDPVRRKEANDKVGQLCPRAASLTIRARKNHTRIRAKLSIDGRSASIIEGPIWANVDKGAHVVTVSAPNHKPWVMTVDVVDGDHIAFDAPTLEPVVTNAVGPGGSVRVWRENLAKGTIITQSLAVMGTGGALLASSNNSTDESSAFMGIGIGVMALGAVALGGVILVTLSNAPQSKTAQSQWQFGVNPNGLTLRARW
ncbi:MAG TPA: hypothetical protein PK156_28715 [Polyangium sp.]|nr:hypothetical protein [Polyangium sp.]